VSARDSYHLASRAGAAKDRDLAARNTRNIRDGRDQFVVGFSFLRRRCDPKHEAAWFGTKDPAALRARTRDNLYRYKI
jgi:hypothetical protein